MALRPLARYGLAIGATLATMAASLRLDPAWTAQHPFVLFMPIVMLSGWLGGLGPGLLSTLLFAATSAYWLKPFGSWMVSDKADLLAPALFVVVGALFSLLNLAWRRGVAALARSEEQLVADRVQLERLTGQVAALITRCSRDLRFLFVNKACADFLRKAPDEILDRSVAEVMGEEAFQVVRPYIDRVLRGERVEFETQIPCLEAGRRYIPVVYVPDLDRQGSVCGWIGTMSDITERKAAEMSLRLNSAWLAGQKEAFQAAVNGAPLEVSLGVLIRTAIEQTDGQARCAFYIANREGTELHHVTGMPAPYDRAVDIKIGDDSPGCGFAVSIGQPVITRDVAEEPRWKDWLPVAEEYGFRACWSFPVGTSDGTNVGSFAMYFREPRAATAADRELAAVITHSAAIIISQHLESQERARIARELEAASRQKDQFLALLGHELRNPLFPISTASELLSRTLAGDGRVRLPIDIIKRQSAQLTRLVDDLLDVGRITQGRIQLQRVPLDLADVIAQALETIEPKLTEKRHAVSVLSSDGPVYVNGDFARLVQCLGNVLANAAKYTEPHGKVRIETRAEADTAIIRVCDTGVGIAPALLPDLFGLFVQGDRTLDRSEGGLGIGLAVVKQLVQMHDGEVKAESAGVGKGTTIEIRLPRIARSEQRPAPSAVRDVPARRVLIVEDNVDAANSLAELLRLAGHQTVVALGGRQALEAVESFRPEVALVDIGLPGIDGYQLAQRLRANLSFDALRLVAVTGYGQAQDRERARQAGFDDHLVKPVDLAALERTLARTHAPGPGNRLGVA